MSAIRPVTYRVEVDSPLAGVAWMRGRVVVDPAELAATVERIARGDRPSRLRLRVLFLIDAVTTVAVASLTALAAVLWGWSW